MFSTYHYLLYYQQSLLIIFNVDISTITYRRTDWRYHATEQSTALTESHNILNGGGISKESIKAYSILI
jgi:hypothetical protein